MPREPRLMCVAGPLIAGRAVGALKRLLFLSFFVAVAYPATAFSQVPSVGLASDSVPSLPTTMFRDADGKVTVRATRLKGKFTLDGALNEEVYRRVAPYTDFVQQEPNEGAPATEKTEAWVFFDDQYLYVGARLHESESGKRVASDMRRDANNMYNNDHLAVMFDTFNDHRNGFGFEANRLGGLFDFSATNESPSSNWNALWEVQARDFDGGWSIEFRIPFRSIRFKDGADTWGVNIRRMVRWKNEVSFLSAVPQSWGRRGLNKISSAATMTGMVTPGRGLNLDVKPYSLGSVLTNRLAKPVIARQLHGNVGGDAKWGVTQQIVADFTVNTDFAQVEDDEAQINLTRFSLIFPEKREFFLEGQDAFAFGGVGGGGGGGSSGGGPNPGAPFADNLSPILFYSRRIGLASGEVAPIIGGARVLGRAGSWQVGALDMQTDKVASVGAPSTNFSVLRVNRDVGTRSRVGLVATGRTASTDTNNVAVGLDAQLNLKDDLSIIAYAARSHTGGRVGDQSSYRGRMDWNADRYAVNLEHLFVGDAFAPGVGFMRRSAFRRSYAMARFSPRPVGIPHVRKLSWQSSADYITSPTGAVQSEQLQGAMATELTNGDFLNTDVTRSFEQLDRAFDVARGVTVPVGGYWYTNARASYVFGPQRPLSGLLQFGRGGFYGGTLTEATWRGRVEVSPHLVVEPTLSFNHLVGKYGNGNTNLISSRATYTITTRMFVAGLVQYQSRSQAVATNLRFRWEYQPGSEVFVVYSDGRTTMGPSFPELQNRSIVVKATKLLRW
jgi:hypothetical protein